MTDRPLQKWKIPKDVMQYWAEINTIQRTNGMMHLDPARCRPL
jgi:hypothetical protein